VPDSKLRILALNIATVKEERRMNGKSECCGAPLVQDETGDKICFACGTIQDNYPNKEERKDGQQLTSDSEES
jgi:hypothetical protein